LAVETKALAGRLSPEQKAFLERVQQLGGVAIVARSVDDLERELGDQDLLFEPESTRRKHG
jgi:hypothetical protein